MTRKTITTAALACLLLAGGPLFAGNEDGEHEAHEVKVHKVHIEADCEGDCPEMQHRVFISEDGTRTELDGEGMKWIHAETDCEGDCPEMQRRIFISEDGTTTELHGDDMKWVHLDGHHGMMAGGKR